ncbi:MAG: hypothetical protein QOE70_3417 [Chthoniobacter sp.]|nr:hypothetical protein [Chthoniobacter sp.]
MRCSFLRRRGRHAGPEEWVRQGQADSKGGRTRVRASSKGSPALLLEHWRRGSRAVCGATARYRTLFHRLCTNLRYSSTTSAPRNGRTSFTFRQVNLVQWKAIVLPSPQKRRGGFHDILGRYDIGILPPKDALGIGLHKEIRVWDAWAKCGDGDGRIVGFDSQPFAPREDKSFGRRVGIEQWRGLEADHRRGVDNTPAVPAQHRRQEQFRQA